MFPAVAEIIRWPAEISSPGEAALGGATEPFPAGVAIVVESSKWDVHDVSGAESIVSANALSEAPG